MAPHLSQVWGEEGSQTGSRIIPSPLGGALGTSRDRILFLAGEEGGVEQSPPCSPAPPASTPPPPHRLPLGQTSFHLLLPPPPPYLGRLSQTEEEARLPGRVGLPGKAQPQCDPASPGNSPNLGPQRTSGNLEGWQQGLSERLRICGMPLRSGCWRLPT